MRQHDRPTQQSSVWRRVRRTRVLVERREVQIVSVGRPFVRGWCGQCAATVAFVATDVAALVARQPVPTIVERAETGEVHASDTARPGSKLICLASLLE